MTQGEQSAKTWSSCGPEDVEKEGALQSSLNKSYVGVK